MATWKAECWLGSQAGRQTLQVEASTYSGAKEQLQRIYGADRISNLRQVSGTSGMITADIPDGQATALALESLFKVLGFLLTLLFRGIARLSAYLRRRHGR